MKRTLLIVDDDLSILKLLNFILSKEYDIVVKNNGIEAFSWLEDGNMPELIISDLQMPYFDGQSFVKNVKISGFYREIPVILLSAAHDLDAQVSAMPFKVDAYIHKPFNPTALKQPLTKFYKFMNHQTSDWNESSGSTIRIAYAGTEFKEKISNGLNEGFKIAYSTSIDQLNEYLGDQSILSVPDIILVEIDAAGKWIKLVDEVKKSFLLNGLIIVLLSSQNDKSLRQQAIKLKVHDFYGEPFSISDLRERLNFLVRFKLIKPKLLELSKVVDTAYKMPSGKRLIDLMISGGMMLALSPVMLVVAILIKLDSKGPVFYKSKRVGTGYKVFDFYKFRSMRTDADQLLAKLSAENNQYASEAGDNKVAFVKIKNDPRITKLGNFLRNSSLDELPQLFNILRGDMSVVGNRPLPLYEAEMLTSNEWSMRFLGPAGLTGLWQISKRGKEDMSERERKKLDNFYAQKYSVWLDLKLLWVQFPPCSKKKKYNIMPVKLKLTYLFIIVLLFTSRAQAQQNSFISDINYPYLEKLIATAKKNYPEVKARQSQVNAAKGLYNSTVFSWLDGLTASYIYSPQTSINISQPTIFKGYQLALSLNIGQLFSRPGAIRQAKETYKVAEYQQAEYMLSLEAQIKRFYFTYLEAQADLRMRSNAVIDAESAVKQLKYAFQKGETTFQIYNEQLNSLYNQNSFKVQAELATFTAKTNLEELLGTKLEDVK